MLSVAQAMQQWGGQQWPGAMTPLGLAQGWLRPYGMGPAAVGMSPRGPSQGLFIGCLLHIVINVEIAHAIKAMVQVDTPLQSSASANRYSTLR